jgi:mannose-1-phosphate guanylyltransferase
MAGRLWSVVLAAGAGTRLSSRTGGIPKQFWRPHGGSSLLEETLARLTPICPADRTVIVVGDQQRTHVRRWPAYRQRGRIVFQPADRGTAAGMLFGLLPILAADPHGVVVVTPSDHGVRNGGVYRSGILEAVAHAQFPGGIVIFGVAASAARTDYGWITLGSERRWTRIQPVASFVEKPDAGTAAQLLADGAAWNTMVIVARVEDLLDLCRVHVPDVTAMFDQALTLPRRQRHAFVAERYPGLSVADFSRDVATPSRALSAYTWPASMGWSDLGTPERLDRWLRPAPLAAALVDTAEAARQVHR